MHTSYDPPHRSPNPSVFTALWLFALFAAVFLFTRSMSLDDWDSVQFLRGVVDRYDIGAHQPHPSGYPLYIFFGWLQTLVGVDGEFALKAVSAASGGVFVAAWFLVFRQSFPYGLSLAAAVALGFVPAVWMTTTKVLTDMPSAAFLAVALWAGCTARWLHGVGRDRLWAALAGLAAAVAMGFRPQNVLVALLILLAVLWGRGAVKRYGAALGAFVAGVLAWGLPMLWTQARLYPSKGWGAYFEFARDQWRWRLDKPHVSVFAKEYDPAYLLDRLQDHFIDGVMGRGFGSHAGGVWERLIPWACIAGVLLAFWAAGRRADRFAIGGFLARHLVWALPYTVLIYTTLPNDARYYVPVIPVILAVPVFGAYAAFPGKGRVLAAAFPLLFLTVSAGMAWQAHTEPAPPEKVVRIIRETAQEMGIEHPLVLAGSSQRHLAYRMPEARLNPPGRYLEPEDFAGEEVFFSDNQSLVRDIVTRAPERYDVLSTTFNRSPVIHRKHSEIRLYMITPLPPGR